MECFEFLTRFVVAMPFALL